METLQMIAVLILGAIILIPIAVCLIFFIIGMWNIILFGELVEFNGIVNLFRKKKS